MIQNIPIYLCNVDMVIYNKRNNQSKRLDLFELRECVLKGFTLDDMKSRNSMNRLLKNVNKKVKLNPNEELRISNIEFIKQLGFGVNE